MTCDRSTETRKLSGPCIAADAEVSPSALLHEKITIESGAVVGPGVIFASGGETRTVLRAGTRVGAGAVIGAGVELGWRARVEPGCVVLSSVPPNAIVQGNPARIVGYTKDATTELTADVQTTSLGTTLNAVRQPTAHPLGVGRSALYQLPRVDDLRGSLSVGEFGEHFPFTPRRYFLVFDVPSEDLRGEHAHHVCHQLLICVHGSCRALVDDGTARREILLDRPDIGLYMPPMIWGTQYRYTQDAVVLVLASHPYDAADYIRTYDEFRAAVSERAE